LSIAFWQGERTFKISNVDSNKVEKGKKGSRKKNGAWN